MSLLPVYGHEALRARLGAAAVSGRLPQALLLVGPEGAGKQRLALWLAQALVCEDAAAEPCGRCAACRLVGELAHPDVHWFVPVARLKPGETSRQVDEAKLAIAEVVAERRESGRWEAADGTHGHWLACVRLLQRVVGLTPFRGSRKVIILGEAERLVVQDANLEAANALLKVLEEPPADAVLILTSSEPQALLPTIRSRVVPIRVGRIPDGAVRAFVHGAVQPDLRGAALDRLVAQADGRAGRTVRARAREAPGRRAQALLDGAREGAHAWAALALAQAPWGARGDFADVLDELAVALHERVGRAAARDDRAAVNRTLAVLERVHAVREAVGTNVNPQLALAELGRELEAVG